MDDDLRILLAGLAFIVFVLVSWRLLNEAKGDEND